MQLKHHSLFEKERPNSNRRSLSISKVARSPYTKVVRYKLSNLRPVNISIYQNMSK